MLGRTFRKGDVDVYDIEVEGLHNFFVRGPGSDAPGVLVHNSTVPTPTEGQSVYRVYGGDAKAGGASWSPTNPADVSDYRNGAGLPSGGESGATNTGQFVIEGTLTDPTKVVRTKPADALDGNAGGLPEYIIPDAVESGAVRVDRVSGANPEF